MINVLSSLNLRHQNAALAVLKLVSGHVAAILFLILHTPQCSQAQLIGKIRSMVNSNSPAGALRQPDENEKKLLTAIDANNLADFTATIKKPVLLVNRIDRTTLMILAAKKGSLEMVQTLAEKPQSATRMDYKVYSARSNSVYYATPLAAAAGEAPREVIDFLLEKSKADTLITKASIQRRDAPFAGKLLNPLDAAAYNGRVAIFQSLLEKGYKINRSSAQSSSTLLWAAKGSCWECVDLCLKLKANFFDKDEGWSLLHYYAQNGRDKDVQGCLDKGFYVDIATQANTSASDDYTPLMLAAQKGHLSTCRLLMLYGADPTLRNAAQKTGIQLAGGNGFKEVEKALQKGDILPTDRTWTDLFTEARKAYLNGEYIIANSMANAAFRKVALPTDQVQSDYLSLIRLLATTYEQMAVFKKAEKYYTLWVEKTEKVHGNKSTPYVDAMGQLSSFYNKTAQYDKSRILLEVLQTQATKQDIPYVASLMAGYYLAVGNKEKANLLLTGYFASRKDSTGTTYRDLLPMLQTLQEVRVGGGGSDILTNFIAMAVAQWVKLQFTMFTDPDIEDEIVGKAKESRPSTQERTIRQGFSVVRKMITQKQIDEDAYNAGRGIANSLSPLVVFWEGKGTAMLTVERAEQMAQAVKTEEGTNSQNYISTLMLLCYTYEKKEDKQNVTRVSKLIEEKQLAIKKNNFQRGLAYFPPTAEHILALIQPKPSGGLDALKNLGGQTLSKPAPSDTINTLERLMRYRTTVSRAYGKIHPLYVYVLKGIIKEAPSSIRFKTNPLKTECENELNFINSVITSSFTPPSLNVSTYIQLLPEIETHRNGLKSFILDWTKKAPVVNSFLYDLVLNEKERLLFSLVEARRKKNPEYLFEEGLYKDLRHVNSDDSEEQMGFFRSKSARWIWDGTDAAISDMQARALGVNGQSMSYPFVWQQIQKTLKPGQVALDFFYIEQSLANTDSTGVDYFALVIKPNQAEPTLVRLFAEKDLIPVINYAGGKTQETIQAIYRGGKVSQAADKSPQKPQAPPSPGKLYQLCWEPIQKLLTKADTVIYYSPSGLLHKVSFAAIVTPTQTYLGAKCQLRYQTSTQNLLEGSTTIPITASTTAALFGNPPTSLPNLSGAAEEVRIITQELESKKAIVNSFLGEQATEVQLKAIGTQLRSPRIVLISTHGIYANDPSPGRDPMLKSALLLAKGDASKINSLSGGDANDGILTASEISSLNFVNTQLVILSACESGLGDVAGVEGVFGLQRALKEAGAEYVLVSLWPVDDAATAELIRLFFENMVDKLQLVPDAFMNAQRTMMQRKEYQPYHWASFVLMR